MPTISSPQIFSKSLIFIVLIHPPASTISTGIIQLTFSFACTKSLIHDTKYIKHTFNMMNQGYNVLYK